jgi:hypothetical protein
VFFGEKGFISRILDFKPYFVYSERPSLPGRKGVSMSVDRNGLMAFFRECRARHVTERDVSNTFDFIQPFLDLADTGLVPSWTLNDFSEEAAKQGIKSLVILGPRRVLAKTVNSDEPESYFQDLKRSVVSKRFRERVPPCRLEKAIGHELYASLSTHLWDCLRPGEYVRHIRHTIYHDMLLWFIGLRLVGRVTETDKLMWDMLNVKSFIPVYEEGDRSGVWYATVRPGE